jgi:hypothetical protein
MREDVEMETQIESSSLAEPGADLARKPPQREEFADSGG